MKLLPHLAALLNAGLQHGLRWLQQAFQAGTPRPAPRLVPIPIRSEQGLRPTGRRPLGRRD